MKMLHSTSRKKLNAILRDGILCKKARNQNRPSIWLCAPGMIGDSITHAMRRHRLKPTNVVVITVDVPRSWLRADRHGRTGVKHTGGRDIPRERIVSAVVLTQWG